MRGAILAAALILSLLTAPATAGASPGSDLCLSTQDSRIITASGDVVHVVSADVYHRGGEPISLWQDGERVSIPTIDDRHHVTAVPPANQTQHYTYGPPAPGADIDASVFTIRNETGAGIAVLTVGPDGRAWLTEGSTTTGSDGLPVVNTTSRQYAAPLHWTYIATPFEPVVLGDTRGRCAQFR